MKAENVSSLIAISLIASPMVLSKASAQEINRAASIRSSQRQMIYQLQAAPKLLPMGVHVGELQERWQFPSDHLPVGITYDDLHIGSWNVLDAKFMKWVLENSQGLSRSLIADEHIYLDGTKLTKRDIHVSNIILEMLSHPTHPRSILSLQECSDAFVEHLRRQLPSNYRVIHHDGEAMIVDQNLFDVASEKKVVGVFSEIKDRSFQEIVLQRKDTQESIRLLNVHLPGNPLGDARFELAQYLKNSSAMPTLTMGDMNFNEIEMKEACSEFMDDFRIYTPYCTNISVSTSDHPFISKAIDHFILNHPQKVRANSAEEVWIGLEKTSQLLNPGSYAASGRDSRCD